MYTEKLSMIRMSAKQNPKPTATKPVTSAKPTPLQDAPRKRGRPKGSGAGKGPDAKVPVTIRLHPDVLERLKAKGKDWRQVAAELITSGV